MQKQYGRLDDKIKALQSDDIISWEASCTRQTSATHCLATTVNETHFLFAQTLYTAKKRIPLDAWILIALTAGV
jgi:hypothetical protein